MSKIQPSTNLEKHTSKNPLHQLLLNNFYSSIFSMIKSLSVISILDAGCGEGFTLFKLNNEGIGKQYEGIDYSSQAIMDAKKMFPKFSFKTGSLYKLPYQDKSFDLVICTEVLEHLDNPQKGLLEIIRVSKKYVLITVPNEPWFTIQRFLRGKNVLKFGDHPEHINHWNPESFKKFLRKQNIISIKLPFPWIAVLLKK